MATAVSFNDINLGELLLTRVMRTAEVLTAIAHIAGVPHHATLVRVEQADDGDGCRQVAVDDPDGHLDLFDRADPGADGPLCSLALPDRAGEWVLLISPCCQ